MALTPSPARRLIVPRRDASPRGFVPAPMIHRWPDKNRAAKLDYAVDVTNELVTGDFVTAAVAAVTPSLPGGLVASDASITGNTVVVWLEDGVAGVDYTVTLTIASDQDRAIVLPLKILIPE